MHVDPAVSDLWSVMTCRSLDLRLNEVMTHCGPNIKWRTGSNGSNLSPDQCTVLLAFLKEHY